MRNQYTVTSYFANNRGILECYATIEEIKNYYNMINYFNTEEKQVQRLKITNKKGNSMYINSILNDNYYKF